MNTNEPKLLNVSVTHEHNADMAIIKFSMCGEEWVNEIEPYHYENGGRIVSKEIIISGVIFEIDTTLSKKCRVLSSKKHYDEAKTMTIDFVVELCTPFDREVILDFFREDREQNMVILEPSYLDSAIIGSTEVDGDEVLVYAHDAIVQAYVEHEGMGFEEAIEFVEHNTMRALPMMPKGRPIIIHRVMLHKFGGFQ